MLKLQVFWNWRKLCFLGFLLFLRLWANPSFIVFSIYPIPPEVKKWREMKLYNFSLHLQKKSLVIYYPEPLMVWLSASVQIQTRALLNKIIHAKKKRDEEFLVFCNKMGLLLCNLFHGILLFAHRFWFSIFRRCLFIIKTVVSWFCSISSVHLRVLALLSKGFQRSFVIEQTYCSPGLKFQSCECDYQFNDFYFL